VKKFRVACLLSREAGLSVLNSLFTPESPFEMACLFTNKREPSSKDPSRPDRPEYAAYAKIAAENGYPFYTVDTYSEAKAMAGMRERLPFDFIFSVSWAFLVPPDVLALPTIAPINQHRGKLPDYPLAAPVVQALKNGDDTIILSTHRMNEVYDEGEMLIETAHPANFDDSQSLEANAERIKRELLPLYPQALVEAVQKLTGEIIE